MFRKYEEHGAGEPRTVRKLMSSRKATPVVLGFIAAIRAGQRAWGEEQERQQKEQERDKAWGLEVDRLDGNEKEEAGKEREERETRGEG